MERDSEIPLVKRFPALQALPRARLGRFPSPVECLEALAPDLWVKREDLNAEPLGGNKVRALEFLLGGVRAGDTVATVGAAGSTHALATAIYARQLGARSLVFRWRQEMNEVAEGVADRLAADASHAPLHRSVLGAYVRALVARWRGARWIPAGGSSPLGVLGQINAALELAEQVNNRVMPSPDRVVVPLGTGGTAAGLALGFAVAGMKTRVVAVQVVPRIVANAAHVRRLIGRTARFVEHLTGESLTRPAKRELEILHGYYGGAYGRVTAAGAQAVRQCRECAGIAVDLTYGAKAMAAAIQLANERDGVTLFWLSFDGRWMRHSDVPPATEIVARGSQA